jgi:hypothetical protein
MVFLLLVGCPGKGETMLGAYPGPVNETLSRSLR